MNEAAAIELIRRALRFACWAAGEGICPADGEPAEDPADILCDYSNVTGDEDWETLSDRFAANMAHRLSE